MSHARIIIISDHEYSSKTYHDRPRLKFFGLSKKCTSSDATRTSGWRLRNSKRARVPHLRAPMTILWGSLCCWAVSSMVRLRNWRSNAKSVNKQRQINEVSKAGQHNLFRPVCARLGFLCWCWCRPQLSLNSTPKSWDCHFDADKSLVLGNSQTESIFFLRQRWIYNNKSKLWIRIHACTCQRRCTHKAINKCQECTCSVSNWILLLFMRINKNLFFGLIKQNDNDNTNCTTIKVATFYCRFDTPVNNCSTSRLSQLLLKKHFINSNYRPKTGPF